MPLPLALLAPHSHAHLRLLQSRATFRFLSLPAELRLQIYSYLFDRGSIYCIIHRGHIPSVYRFCPQWEALHIRLVCRQIHEETTGFIFERLEVVHIDMGWLSLLERRLTGIPLLEANWRRIRSFKLDVRPPHVIDSTTEYVDVMESHLTDVERFLRNYFVPGEEGKMELKSLVVNVSRHLFREDPPEFCCPALVGLTDEHPLFR